MKRNEVLRTILEADEDFIEEILTVAMKRKQQLYPDWDIRYLAMPRTEGERQRYERAWKVLTE
ncbi:MAG: hypothetical protein Q4F81_11245 [Eubacteriales bacterium]|nr:hypothetical protein [Eubacteriales bacterium]